MTNNSEHKIHAKAGTVVHAYKPTVYEQPSGGTALTQVHLEETFDGDIAGEGVAEVLQATRPDGSVSFVAIERIKGSVGNKKGTFLLQVTGTVVNKLMDATWLVIPGSGTAELAKLRGEGGFQATLGEHGDAMLDYWFEP